MLSDILLPCAAMVGLTACVWARALNERIAEIRLRRIAPQSLATTPDATRTLRNVQAVDNFSNLFELPVLFYVLCIALAATNNGTTVYVTAAWIFVVLRVVHSLIHVTYNFVLHRFAVWLLGAVWLFIMWGSFAVERIAR